MGYVHFNGNLKYRTAYIPGSRRILFENISSTTEGVDEFMVTDSGIGVDGYVDLSVALYDKINPPINPTKYGTTRFHVFAGKYKYNQVNDFSLSEEEYNDFVAGLPLFDDGFELFVERSDGTKGWQVNRFLLSGSIIPPTISTPTLTLNNDFANTTINVSWNDVITTTPDSSRLTYEYQLYRSTNGVDFDLIATLDHNTISYQDTGREIDVRYYYYVVAISGTDYSVKTSAIKSTVLTINPTVVIDTITPTSSSSSDIYCEVGAGMNPIIDKGIVYSNVTGATTPTISVGSGDTHYTASLTGMANRLYYVRAYVTTIHGTFYSESKRVMPFLGDVTLLKRTSSGSITIPENVNYIHFLLVAGGGGGGSARSFDSFSTAEGGGGGAGGVITGSTVITPGSYPIVIGAGGSPRSTINSASNGQNSTAFGFTAIGGGAGGFDRADVTSIRIGNDGGSGGGGAGAGSNGGLGTAGQGKNGGVGTGGGGGFTSNGGTEPNSNGGTGLSWNWDGGILKTYAEGGDGGAGGSAGSDNGESAAANTGSGGNGNRDNAATLKTGGSGGSGVFLALAGFNYFVIEETDLDLTTESFDCDSAVYLSWNSVLNTPYTSGYKIYRSTDNVYFELIDTVDSDTLEYVDSNLNNGTYYYYVEAFTETDSLESNTESETILFLAPTLGGSVTLEGIDLTWVDNNGCGTGFQLERRLSPAGDWEIIDSPTSGITSYLDEDVVVGSVYDYRIKQFNINGESPYSDIVTGDYNINPPEAPTLDFVSGITSSQVLLSWTNNHPSTGFTGLDGFEIYRKKLSGGDFILMDSVGSGVTTTTITEPIDDDFEYKVRVVNGTGIGDSNSIILPLYPSYTGSTSVTRSVQNELDFSWVNNSDYVTDIEVYYSTDNENYSLLTTLTSGNTTYNHTGLDEDTVYYYKLRYKNGTNSISTFTQEVSQLTYLNTPILSIQQSGTKQLTISWSDNSEHETGYQIYRKKGDGAYSLIHTTASNITSYVDENLDLNATYTYYVRAIKED